MIDIHNESLIQFRELPAWCQKNLGNRIHTSTAHRWRLRGARGVKLETILAGGTRYTSLEALSRFFAATTAIADGVPVVVETATLDAREIEEAEAYLESEGI